MLSCLLNGQRINCFDGTYNRDQLKKWSNKRILLCPACGKPYEYCHGKVIQPYFRHKDKNQCEDQYSEPETEEHLQGKRDLYEWLKRQNDVTDVILEGWIPETKQRPDIMFKYKGRQCVLEYQCSPISTEYYERHELYQAAGINDYWICGTQKYLQYYHKGNDNKRVNELEGKCKIYYDVNNGCMFIIKYMDEKSFNKVFNKKYKKRSEYLMEDIYDYSPGKQNYFVVKDKFQSYSSYTYYPSPTGRPSNKYPYPVTGYNFDTNVSLARCIPLNILSLKD